MPSLKKLMERRGELVNEIRRLADLEEFSGSDQDAWDAANDDLNGVDQQIERIQRADSLHADVEVRDEVRAVRNLEIPESNVVTDEHRNLALNAWARARGDASDGLTGEMRAAATACGLNLGNELRLTLPSVAPRTIEEARALSAIQGSTGGFTVAPAFVSQLENALLQFGGMRQVSDIIRTSTGAEMSWPTVDDTSNEGEIIGESGDHSSGTDLDFEQLKWFAYQFSSKIIQVPVQLLQDSAFDMNVLLGNICGERIGRKNETEFTTGTGASKPYGIVTQAATGVTTAGSTAITADEVIDLAHSVDPAYRMNAKFMLHDTVLKYLRKLKDDNGQYLWMPGLQAGIPDKLYGFDLQVNQKMSPTITSGDSTLLFGDLSKYKIRDVSTMTIRRLVERYAEYNQVGFVTIMRSDGNLLNAGTNPVKKMVQG